MNFEQARFNMVVQQVRTWDVIDERVLRAMEAVKREDFVPPKYRKLAFADLELPLTEGQFMLKPVVEGRMLQALALDGGERVLHIGTGSGFTAACIAALGASVQTVEISPGLAGRARAKLAQAGVSRVEVIVADGLAFNPSGRYDAIAVTASVFDRPERFLPWLKVGGRVFIVHGNSPAMEAVLLTRVDQERFITESLFETDLKPLRGAEAPTRFVF